MTETKHISVRLDEKTKEALQAQLVRDKGRTTGGKAGGISLLFRRLAWLYLDDEMPEQRFEEDDFRWDFATNVRPKIQQFEQAVAEGESLTSGQLRDLELDLKTLLGELANQPHFSQFQKLEHRSLAGRIISIFYRLDHYRIAPPA